MRRALVLLAVASCTPWRQQSVRGGGSVHVDEAGVRGAEVAVAQQYNGIGIRVDVAGQRIERDEMLLAVHRRAMGVGIGLGLAVSPLALVADNDRFTRYFDLGVAGSVGGGLLHEGRLTTYGEAWGGAWATIGLPFLGYANGNVFPMIVVEMRRTAFTDWDDRTVFVLGLALARRFDQSIFGY